MKDEQSYEKVIDIRFIYMVDSIYDQPDNMDT